MNKVKQEVIEVEAESLHAFLQEETMRRVDNIEADYKEGAERRIPEINFRQLVIPFGIMFASIIVHHVVQFVCF